VRPADAHLKAYVALLRVTHPFQNNLLGKRMSKVNLFSLAFIVAVISGVATGSASDLGGVAPIANLLMYGCAAWIGWKCVSASEAKEYAIGAAALVFLNHPAWGDAAATMGQVQWVGPFLAPIFSNLVDIVLLVAAVGMLKKLVDGARSSANVTA